MPMLVIAAAAAVAAALPLLVWSVASARQPRQVPADNLTRGLRAPDLRELLLARAANERAVPPATRLLARLGRRLTPASAAERLQRRIVLAGQPAEWPLERVLAAKLLLFATGAMVGVARVTAAPTTWTVVQAVTLAGMGFLLPDVVLRGRASRRQRDIRTALPDTLDQMTVCVEAGLAFEAAMARTARGGDGPLANELVRALHETRVGATRSEALANLVDRTEVPELRRVVTALRQADVHGIPIAQVLRTQAKDLRVRRRQRAEEHAHKIPVKLIFPLVTCILPSLIIVILGPAGIQMMRFFGEATP